MWLQLYSKTMKTFKIIFSFIYVMIFEYLIFFVLLFGAALGEILEVKRDSVLDFTIMLFFFHIVYYSLYNVGEKNIRKLVVHFAYYYLINFKDIYIYIHITFFNIAIINTLVGLYFLLTSKKK